MTNQNFELWNNVTKFLERFVSYPNRHASVAHTLWIAHSHLMDEWDTTPRLAFLSAEPASGKSRALEVTSMLVPRPIEAVNSSPAYIVRKVSDDCGLPTILYDEIDAVFGPKNQKGNEDLRSILNAGYRRHSMIGRCTVTKSGQIGTEELPAYAAVALAGLGNLPDTIVSRSIIIRMKRRAPSEPVEPFRRRSEEVRAMELRTEIEAWAKGLEGIGGSVLPPPTGISDRDADIWESLLTVARSLGGDWPGRAESAAHHFVRASKEINRSLGVQLLFDIRAILDDEVQLSSNDLCTRLANLQEAPWGKINGEQICPRVLASLLKEFDVEPKVLTFEHKQARGYTNGMFHDAWERYLPPG